MLAYLSLSTLFFILLGAITAVEMHNPEFPLLMRYVPPVFCAGMVAWSIILSIDAVTLG